MACMIAHWCPGFGNPWHMTIGEWMRILDRMPDVKDQARGILRDAIQSVGQDTNMEVAMSMARKSKRMAKHGRRL